MNKHPIPFVLKQGWADKGHIAGYEGHKRIFCRMQRAGQATQSAAPRLQIGIEWNTKERVILRPIRHKEDVFRRRFQAFENPQDKRAV